METTGRSLAIINRAIILDGGLDLLRRPFVQPIIA